MIIETKMEITTKEVLLLCQTEVIWDKGPIDNNFVHQTAYHNLKISNPEYALLALHKNLFFSIRLLSLVFLAIFIMLSYPLLELLI